MRRAAACAEAGTGSQAAGRSRPGRPRRACSPLHARAQPHPGVAAATATWLTGRDYKRLITWMPYTANMLVLTRDRGSGRVKIGADGLPRIHYWPCAGDRANMLKARRRPRGAGRPALPLQAAARPFGQRAQDRSAGGRLLQPVSPGRVRRMPAGQSDEMRAPCMLHAQRRVRPRPPGRRTYRASRCAGPRAGTARDERGGRVHVRHAADARGPGPRALPARAPGGRLALRPGRLRGVPGRRAQDRRAPRSRPPAALWR